MFSAKSALELLMVGTGEYEEESSQFERPLTQMRISIQLAHINDTTKPSVKNNNNDYLNLTIFKVLVIRNAFIFFIKIVTLTFSYN